MLQIRHSHDILLETKGVVSVSENDFSRKVRALRAEQGLTLEQVANHVGVGRSTVRKWENGMIENIRRDKIAKLAEALHTTPAYLMSWTTDEDSWTESFRKNLVRIIESLDPADIHDSGINIHFFSKFTEPGCQISLSQACVIADMLGESLDEMVGLREEKPATQTDSRLNDAAIIFAELSSDNQTKLLELSRLYLDAQRRTEGTE